MSNRITRISTRRLQIRGVIKFIPWPIARIGLIVHHWRSRKVSLLTKLRESLFPFLGIIRLRARSIIFVASVIWQLKCHRDSELRLSCGSSSHRHFDHGKSLRLRLIIMHSFNNTQLKWLYDSPSYLTCYPWHLSVMTKSPFTYICIKT